MGSCLAVRRRDAPPRGREGVATGRRLQPFTYMTKGRNVGDFGRGRLEQ
jgi:hypothetical protein